MREISKKTPSDPRLDAIAARISRLAEEASAEGDPQLVGLLHAAYYRAYQTAALRLRDQSGKILPIEGEA